MIPLSFTFAGKQYYGTLSSVHGGGAHVYHLMINNYFYGSLRFVGEGWVFDTNPGSIGWEVLAEYFGEVVERQARS